ncbi:MAG: hypothetical protein APR63_03370 [Desulfuromonas sp. SDB]|nr:MAG: hypothetical protein APR63_03370 [Desulfuromonas sp. SDB]
MSKLSNQSLKSILIIILFAVISVIALISINTVNITTGDITSPPPAEDSVYSAFQSYKMQMRGDDPSKKPTEWFTLSRAYPYEQIPHQAYLRALNQAVAVRNATMNTDQFNAIPAGPTNVGGRITAVAVHPDNLNIIYAGAALGGVFKSTDGGSSWVPISDDVPSLSCGDVAVDPQNPDTIYFGTGEANSSGDSYSGTGVYRSTDGGVTWEFLGLPNSHHVGRIAVDPENSQIILVAAMGKLFGKNPERGVYRSSDGGATWNKVLYLNDSTGCIDIVINPRNSDTVFAAMWERIRKPDYRSVGGLSSGIWRSTDNGLTWNKLTNGLPPDSPTNGRIGLAISPSNPDVIYASYVDHPGNLMGIWRSTDGGNSWQSRLVSPGTSSFSGFGWYFGQIWCDPGNANTIYLGDVSLWKSTDGGQNWNTIGDQMHVDHHAMFISDQGNFMAEGNDGGFYISTNGGNSWNKCNTLPITQFYAITIDQLNPQRLYGGTQDNSTPRTLTGALDDWDVLFYGDGFYTIVDYTNSNIIYAEAQYGYLGKSTDLGYNWDIIFTNYSHGERTNWMTPVVMSPHNHQVLFYGAQRLWKTTNGGNQWNPVSPDLTGGSGGGNLTYGTITTISQSPLNADVIWVGTDDSRVWVTTNGGTNWNMVSSSLPDRWCTRVTADVYQQNTAYVTFSGYKQDELLPHIYKTDNLGSSWTDISGNLTDVPVNDILPDPDIPDRLYIGTDFGCYYSDDGGNIWQVMGSDHPIVPVFDIDLHQNQRILVSGTHGRSMYLFDISSTGVEEEPELITADFRFNKNYPEPFEQQTTISFEVLKSTHLKVKVFDVNGRLVETLMDQPVNPGEHQLEFKAQGLASGTYFLSISSGYHQISHRITLIK